MAYEALYTRGRPKTLAHLVGQEHISSALSRAILSGRLSHAYLLVGTRGTGKTSTARLLAKAMNCETVHKAVEAGETLSPKEIPCNKCPSCLSIDSSPDNVEFDAASNRSVEDVTRLLSTAYLAPLQSRVKTFIIDEVHMLSTEAINSILKLIEEPPPNVAFFLATTELQKVPMTIRSRCQVLNFRLIPTEIIFPYLIKLARRLEVELPEDAAKKIARLAEGSMRDALTYLDQCYAMSDKVITLDDVNQTLGLISDADLDEIISAVKKKNSADVAKSITQAFRSGLSSISIAESLITRLRDLEFEILNRPNSSEIKNLNRLVEMLRKTVLEMQGSGIPNIILEMALINFVESEVTSDTKNFVQPTQEKFFTTGQTFGNTLDDGKKIFYHIQSSNEVKPTTKNLLKLGITVKDFDGVNLTLAFNKTGSFSLFTGGKENHVQNLEKAAESFVGRKIKIIPVLEESPKDKDSEQFLEESKKIFNAKNVIDFYEREEDV